MVSKSVLLQVFAKYPTPGRVKTRLSTLLTHEQAANVHIELILRLLARLDSLPEWIDIELRGDEPATAEFYSRLLTQFDRLKFAEQCGNDLGERMNHAIQQGLKNYHSVLIIGTDCPVLTCEHITSIARQMAHRKIDIIAAEDGGYVLIAAKTHHSQFFRHKGWGTNRVYKQTQKTADTLGWDFQSHGMLWDVDVPQDYERYLKMCKKL